MSRECNQYEITIGRFLNIVHNYTDPIRINVIVEEERVTCPEAKHIHSFKLVDHLTPYDREEINRLLKYYKDVPVWNLCVWTEQDCEYQKGRYIRMGIEAQCHYRDIREGYLAEKADVAREKRKQYRKRKKMEERDA